MGLPGCVMYAKRTIFDLVLPRIMCDEKLHEKDFRLLGQGGLCLSCPVCTFPNCGFGKEDIKIMRKNNLFKKTVAAGLVLLMTASLAACDGKKTDTKQKTKRQKQRLVKKRM